MITFDCRTHLPQRAFVCGITVLVWAHRSITSTQIVESFVLAGPSIFSENDFSELIGASTPEVYKNIYVPFLDRCLWSQPEALYNASQRMRVQKSRHTQYSEYMYDTCHDPLCLKYHKRFPYRAPVSFCGASDAIKQNDFLVTRVGPIEIPPQRLISWGSFIFMTPAGQAYLTGYFFGLRHTHAHGAVMLHHGNAWTPGVDVPSMTSLTTINFIRSGTKLHVPNSVPDSICPDGPPEPCLFKSFPAGYGQIKLPSFDLEALARVDNLVGSSVNVVVEIGTRWSSCNGIRKIANVFYIQFHMVKDEENAFIMPTSVAPSIRWVSYELPSRGHFVPPPEFHTHPNTPSSVWLLKGRPESSLPREIFLRTPDGDLVVLHNETVATIQAATHALGNVMCRIRSRSYQQGDHYFIKRALYDTSCNENLSQWQFFEGDHLTIVAFNRVVSRAFLQHQDLKLFTFFNDIDTHLKRMCGTRL